MVRTVGIVRAARGASCQYRGVVMQGWRRFFVIPVNRLCLPACVQSLSLRLCY